MNKDMDLGLIKKEKRTEIINEIVAFFKDERGEEIGVIAAEKVLDFFLEKAGDDIYNRGIKDAQKLIKSRMEDFDIDIEAMIRKK